MQVIFSENMSPLPSRRPPLSLSDQAGLEVLNKLQQSAIRLETDYQTFWLPTLSKNNRSIEKTLSIDGIDPDKVVKSYRSKFRSGRKLGSNKSGRAGHFVKGLPSLDTQQAVINGIPVGEDVEEYIQFRKCLYLHNISLYRARLVDLLSPTVITELTHLIRRLDRKTGILTLQLMLITEYSNNFSLLDQCPYAPERENCIEPILIRHALSEAIRLTHLSLENICTDLMLRVVSSSASNLKYLNINNSSVTDVGLMEICGAVMKLRERPLLNRTCKSSEGENSIVRNLAPRWIKSPDKGLMQLMHLEASGLSKLAWIPKNVANQVPLDCGLVAVLTFLTELRVFKTEFGGRAVVSYVKNQAKRRKAPELNLEVLSESRPTAKILKCVAQMCPHLRELRCGWASGSVPPDVDSQDWIPCLDSFRNLSSLSTSDIDYKSESLSEALSVIGAKLVHIHLQELSILRYSLIQHIKTNCPNLEKLSILMTCRIPSSVFSQVIVDKDINMENASTAEGKKVVMAHLKELNLVGPFGCEYVRYVLSGCDNLRSLALGAEWPVAFCNVSPSSVKDLLGKDFMEEVRSSNALTQLEEIHFFAQYKRCRYKLDLEFAKYLLAEFHNLRHLGSFAFWSMTEREKQTLFQTVRNSNRNITFDEDFMERTSLDNRNFCCKKNLTERKNDFACSWLPLKTHQNTFFSEVAELLYGPGVLFPEFVDVEVDEDMEDDDHDDISDDEYQPNDFNPMIALPFCFIQ